MYNIHVKVLIVIKKINLKAKFAYNFLLLLLLLFLWFNDTSSILGKNSEFLQGLQD